LVTPPTARPTLLEASTTVAKFLRVGSFSSR